MICLCSTPSSLFKLPTTKFNSVQCHRIIRQTVENTSFIKRPSYWMGLRKVTKVSRSFRPRNLANLGSKIRFWICRKEHTLRRSWFPNCRKFLLLSDRRSSDTEILKNSLIGAIAYNPDFTFKNVKIISEKWQPQFNCNSSWILFQESICPGILLGILDGAVSPGSPNPNPI